MHMSPVIDIVFLSIHNRLFETPSAVCTHEFKSVGIDAGMSAVGYEFLAVGVGVGTVEVFGTEGVAFLDDETFVVSSIGFVDAPEDGSGSDVTAYEASSVATRRVG